MNRLVLTWITLFTLLLTVGIGLAQEPGQIVLKSIIQKEIVVQGDDGEEETRLVEAGNAIPGDELIVTVTYTNRGDEPAENIILVNPVPEHTVYISGSAAGENTTITFSVDGGGTFDSPANLTLLGEDGLRRTARAEEYTHIRWVLNGLLAPGNSGDVLFRVRLE